MSVKILISGFEPIWGVKKTPSGELAKLWQRTDLPLPEGVETRSIILPQRYGVCTEMLCDQIKAFQPNVILMFGATMKKDPLRFERFAINAESSVMGDDSKVPIKDRPIVIGGPSAYESTLPISYLVDKLMESGTHARASFHGGTHVCNSLMYGVLHYLSTNPLDHKVAAGFMHVSFPNSFGVVEDDLWGTAEWPDLVRASFTIVREVSAYFFGTEEKSEV